LPFNNIIEDEEFRNSVFEFFHAHRMNALPNVQQLIFNPFEINNNDTLSHLDNFDPDFNFFNDTILFNNIADCNYYLEDALNDKIASADLSCDSFSLLHYNIRSIPRNLRSFNNLLANLNCSFSVLGFSETWLCESNLDLYEIDGYCSEHNCRNSRRGGGVGLYVREFIRYKCRPDLDVFNDIMESIFIEIPATCSAMKKAIVIGVVYRPPDTDVPSFIEVLSGILNQVANERKYLYLLGDFNVNLFNCDTHVPTSEFLDAIYSSSLLPLITKPTRISNTSHS
jgi:hypothetical protein